MASQDKPQFQKDSKKIQKWITAVSEHADDGSDQGTESKTDATSEEQTITSVDGVKKEVRLAGLGEALLSKVDEDIMIFVWLADQDFFKTGVVNWPPVLREIQKKCKWSLDPTIIIQRWEKVVYPRIQETQRAAAEFDRKQREESGNWDDFPPPVDRDEPIEMTDEDYKHSLGPYAKRVIEKYGAGQGPPSPVLHNKEANETAYDGPLLEPKIYVPPDSEKPTTRGYVGTKFVGPSQVVPSPAVPAPAVLALAVPASAVPAPAVPAPAVPRMAFRPPFPMPLGISDGDFENRAWAEEDSAIDINEDIYN